MGALHLHLNQRLRRRKSRPSQSVKEITKGKRNNKNSRQQSPEPEKEDLSSLLKEMRAGFRDIRGDLAKSNIKMDSVGNKIDALEKYQKESEKKIYKEMGKMKDEMRVNNETLDNKIKESIAENLNPKCEEIKNFVSLDLRRIVNEEIELREHAKNIDNDNTDEEKGEKTKKKKEKKKKKIPKDESTSSDTNTESEEEVPNPKEKKKKKKKKKSQRESRKNVEAPNSESIRVTTERKNKNVEAPGSENA